MTGWQWPGSYSTYTKENAFKLFVFDVGILGALSELPVKTVLDYGTYKGYYAENFVAQTFRATVWMASVLASRIPVAPARPGRGQDVPYRRPICYWRYSLSIPALLIVACAPSALAS